MEKDVKDTIEVGDKMEDGTIYIGISPDTFRPTYAAPADARMKMDFNTAAKYAQGREFGGKTDFRVPSVGELRLLFENREKGALRGTFTVTGKPPAGWYWSSQTSNGNRSTGKLFSNGYAFNVAGWECHVDRGVGMSVRCVRG